MLHGILAADVPGPGYHWYKLGELDLQPKNYFYFTWSWIIQTDLEVDFAKEKPNQVFEFWARLKFEGPDMPHGQAEDKNAIFLEKIGLVRK